MEVWNRDHRELRPILCRHRTVFHWQGLSQLKQSPGKHSPHPASSRQQWPGLHQAEIRGAHLRVRKEVVQPVACAANETKLASARLLASISARPLCDQRGGFFAQFPVYQLGQPGIINNKGNNNRHRPTTNRTVSNHFPDSKVQRRSGFTLNCDSKIWFDRNMT